MSFWNVRKKVFQTIYATNSIIKNIKNFILKTKVLSELLYISNSCTCAFGKVSAKSIVVFLLEDAVKLRWCWSMVKIAYLIKTLVFVVQKTKRSYAKIYWTFGFGVSNLISVLSFCLKLPYDRLKYCNFSKERSIGQLLLRV